MKSTLRLFVLTLLVAAVTPAVDAAPAPGGHPWCGTGPAKTEVAWARHEAHQRHLARQRGGAAGAVKSSANVFASGDIAVVEDDGTILIPPSPFDLQNKRMQFLRRPKGMSAVRSKLEVKQLIGDKVDLGDDDSVRIDFPAGFEFPFGDEVYTSLWLNSDGNFTFGVSEPFSGRTLDEFLDGPPRIAPLYADLDPSAATGENGVYVNFPSGRVRITYLGVPQFGTENLSTVQVTLFTTGRVNFAYGDEVAVERAVVGVSAFGNGALQLMDYDQDLPFRPPQKVAIAEQFTDQEQFDDFAVGQVFLEHFRDEYTYLVTWLDYPFVLGTGNTFAFELTVNNTSLGTGERRFNFSGALGSDGTLESYVQMGTLSRFPDNPDQVFLGTDSTMTVLGHEIGHRWLAKPRFLDADGNESNALLQSDEAHWSYFFDADGSVMEGMDWEQQPDGSFRSTDRVTSHYSLFDQYLMGLVAPGDVGSFYYIDNPNAGDRDDSPAVGAVRQGDRVDLTVADVVAAVGPRIPASGEAPTRFRMAFLLLGKEGETVSQESIDKLDTIRARWLQFFQEATDFRAEGLTTLFPR